MKIGLIGCGGMGTTHNLSLKALSGKMDVEVTALADCRQEFLERAAKPPALLCRKADRLFAKNMHALFHG